MTDGGDSLAQELSSMPFVPGRWLPPCTEKCLEPTETRRIAQDLLFTSSIALPLALISQNQIGSRVEIGIGIKVSW